MNLDFKPQPPFPIPVKITLTNNSVISAEIILLETRGMLVYLKTPTLKAGDRVTVEFIVPEVEPVTIIEKSQIIKLFVQIQNKKPAYYAEIHFLKIQENNFKQLESFLHQFEIKRIAKHKFKKVKESK